MEYVNKSKVGNWCYLTAYGLIMLAYIIPNFIAFRLLFMLGAAALGVWSWIYRGGKNIDFDTFVAAVVFFVVNFFWIFPLLWRLIPTRKSQVYKDHFSHIFSPEEFKKIYKISK